MAIVKKLYPKQFTSLNGDEPLLNITINRLLHFFSPEDIIILTNNEYRFHVENSVNSISEELVKNIILEPKKKNSSNNRTCCLVRGLKIYNFSASQKRKPRFR